MNIRVFLAVLQDRREVLTATRSPPAVVSEMRIKPSYRGGDQACRGPQYGRLRGSRWQRHCFVSELTSQPLCCCRRRNRYAEAATIFVEELDAGGHPSGTVRSNHLVVT